MNTTSDLNRCLSFINCQLQPHGLTPCDGSGFVRGVTVSRQSGCGGHVFAEKLAACLPNRLPQDARPWTIFDRGLVEVVLRDHHLPARLASFMPEDRVGQLHDIIEDLFSLHPPTETLVRQASETVLHLAELGHAIIVGRGANVITARLPGMLHIRLVGSVEQRVAHLRQFDHLDRKDALQRIEREDGGRRRYLKKHFNKDVDDPLLYHFVINTDWVALEDAAKTVVAFAQNHPAIQMAKDLPAPAKAC